MKKLLRNITLGLACVLGIGGVAYAITTQDNNGFAKADAAVFPDSAYSTITKITLTDIINNPTGVDDWSWEGSSLVVEDGMIKFTNGDYFQLNYLRNDFEEIQRYKGSVHARKPDGTDISWYIWIKTYDTYEGQVKPRNGTQHGDANNFKVYQNFFETSFLRIFTESYGGGSEIWIDSLTIEAQGYHAVYATGDEGCKSVYLSSRDDGYKPHEKTRESGTRYYAPGTTVYSFAVMKEGYVPVTEYEAKLSSAAEGTEGNLYRITHATIPDDADYTFDEVQTKSLNAKVLIEGTNPGITEVYLSTDADATSGSPSGTGFALNKTVYGFVVLNDAAGYEPQDSWEQLGTTNHYRVGNIQTTDSTDKDLGVFGPKCKINLYNGSELVDTLNVTEGDSVNNLTDSQIPSKEGYTFIGYYSQKTGGTKYFDADGKSNITQWQGGANGYAYAQYTEDMTVTINNYEGVWDNNSHGINVTVSKPTSGYTLVFEDTSTDVSPKYTNPGTYEVKFTITADGYTTYNGQGTIKINKADSILNPVPTGIDGLEYTGNALTLINAGAVDYGTITYAWSSTLAVPADSEFDEDHPDRKAVGTYYVFYKTTGDEFHNPIEASIENAIEVKINRIDRTEAIKLNQAVLDYEDILDERFTSIENNLELSRLAFEANAITEDNVNAFELSLLIEDMQITLSEAKVAVTEQLIEAIGTVVYPDSKDAIEEAYDHYTNVLNDTEKGMVNAELKALLDEDKALYDAVDAMAKAINNIPAPAKSQVYYDAVDNTKAAYDNLTEKQLSTLQNATDFNYEKKLLDNVAARKEIELIAKIGDIKYNGGVDDSKTPIETAEAEYATLTVDQKALVVNYRTLVLDRQTYDNVHNAVELIKAIGNVENTQTCKDKIDAARANFDTLKKDEKLLVIGYKNSYKVLDDDEHVYKALVLIDNIGSLAYDTDPEGRIVTAREYYDSLTEDQKIQTGERYLNLLVNSEVESAHITQVNVTWLIIGLVLSVLVIAGGAYYIFTCFRKKKDDDDDDKGPKGKKEPVKVASVGGVLSIAIYTTHYIDAPWIILYIIAPIALLVLIACIVLFLLRKANKGPFLKKEEAPVEEEALSPASAVVEETSSEDDEEVITITDKAGNRFQIRFIKSFTAKLIQASDETKAYYTELKNEVLSYKKTKSRISWYFDSINAGRNYVIKFGMRGKTLCVYYPLNADDYIDTKYKVEKVEAKKYADVPCLYRINNDRRLEYAKELFALVASNLGLTKGEVPTVNYYLPYEERDPLLARGLIKELKVSLDKPAVEEEEEVVRVVENGVLFEIRYNRSYTAKLIQASDEAKSYYNELKNYILSYKKISDRISWHYESFNSGRNQLIKFGVKGKTLCLYFHLNPNDYQDSKYLVEEVTSKKYEEVPCLYRIKNPRRCNYAKELIDVVMNAYGLVKDEEQHETYELPYEPREPLLARGLIKEVKTKAKEEHRSISVSEADASMSDEVAESRIGDDANSKRHFGKKGVINIDIIGRYFLDNDTVDIEALWEKKLVSKNVGYVKVLARGTLDKKLNINLQEYSIQAVKMILLAGGTVKKAK